MATDDARAVFRALVESAEKKFARVRDAPAYAARGGGAAAAVSEHDFHKVFKAYMRLWKFQQENRAKLVESGLQRWEIGEIASRIGQIYFGQYMRTSEARFLLESYVFYEAILYRGYFQGSKAPMKDVNMRFKELRFYARFLLVSLLLNRREMARLLVDNFKALVEDSKANFRETNFKEWKLVVQEIIHFIKVQSPPANGRPLRYCVKFDTHPDSSSCLARFHANKKLKLHDAVLTGYRRNEVKFAELTLDTYRMLQCLEWEPSGSFYQKRPVEANDNLRLKDFSGSSGLIDMNLAVELTDPTLPPNPRKAILYRPTVTHLLAVIATICEGLPPEKILLIYLSSTGGCSALPKVETTGGPKRSSKVKVVPQASREHMPDVHKCQKGYLSGYYENYLSLGPRADGGWNNLCPGDLIPFTRKPLFLVIDSDTSNAFKAERGEAVALLLSPSMPSFKNSSEVKQDGSQFTLFLTAPVLAFCQLVGLPSFDGDTIAYEEAEDIVSKFFSKWEVILSTTLKIDIVWAQVFSDPFLRRLILRFIFCRAVLSLFHTPEDRGQYTPVCLPELPSMVSPYADVVQSSVLQVADHFRVTGCFNNNL
ncbi:hypothetical protein V2J09_021716 [Rumex salicifolius]